VKNKEQKQVSFAQIKSELLSEAQWLLTLNFSLFTFHFSLFFKVYGE